MAKCAITLSEIFKDFDTQKVWDRALLGQINHLIEKLPDSKRKKVMKSLAKTTWEDIDSLGQYNTHTEISLNPKIKMSPASRTAFIFAFRHILMDIKYANLWPFPIDILRIARDSYGAEYDFYDAILKENSVAEVTATLNKNEPGNQGFLQDLKDASTMSRDEFASKRANHHMDDVALEKDNYKIRVFFWSLLGLQVLSTIYAVTYFW